MNTTQRTLRLISILSATAIGGIAVGDALDYFGEPADTDPSAFTGPSIGDDMAIDYLATLPPAMEGGEEGGDPAANGYLNESELLGGGGYDIPTGGPPSPLYGATAFSQQMIRFEEFGTNSFDNAEVATMPFPRPTTGPAPEQDPSNVALSAPASADLDAFLSQIGFVSEPSWDANDTDTNPWEIDVEAHLGRDVDSPPAEGRPPGEGWAHQRWNEFFPKVFFVSAMAGARTNGGIRDTHQRHGYAVGEFGPGGLYHTVYATDATGPVLEGTTAGVGIRFHPNMPLQDHKSIWTFDGTLPPKLLVARYGEPVLFRHYNALPIDPSANRGFGLHTISTHEHNGHNPAESDGYANAFFFPGQFWDYRWPMQLAGHDTVNTLATDPRAATPCEPGETLFIHDDSGVERECGPDGTIMVRGDYREVASTHWFHDHMLDFTAQNVYKGNAAMFNYYSAIDRGNEAHDDGVNLRFPSGTDLSWGNRDYDINLVIGDKAWDAEGQLWFNIFNLDGFLGDQLLTNWLYKPYFDVRARSYRFRLLNGSVSRYLSIALVHERNDNRGEFSGPPGSRVSYDRVGFHMIANDGNILEHALPFDGTLDLDGDGDADEHKGWLPTQAIAERYDIIVDFADHGIQPGDKLYFINTMEHNTGIKADRKIPLDEILDGTYEPVVSNGRWTSGDPVVGKFLELRVHEYTGTDLSMDPTAYEPGGLTMAELPIDVQSAAIDAARHRTFDFDKSGATDSKPWIIKVDGGQGLYADPRRLSAAPQLATGPTDPGFDGTDFDGYDDVGTLEVWHFAGNGGWSHPIHVHFEEGVILSRDGKAPPAWERWARKDIYRIGPEEDSSNNVEIAIRFREFAGTYVEHCHNTQHEDHAMLLRWDLEHPGQVKLMPTPIPTWDGVEYVDSHALPSFRSGDGAGPTFSVPTPIEVGPGVDPAPGNSGTNSHGQNAGGNGNGGGQGRN